jgi:putative membrane protein
VNFLIRLALGVVAVWFTVQLGHMIGVGLGWNGAWNALLFVIVLAIVNAVVRPIAKLLAMPLTCLTFGLFSFVVNALLFWAVAHFSGWLDVRNFWAALFGSVVFGILSGMINSLVKRQSGSRSR